MARSKKLPIEDFVFEWAISRIGTPTKITKSKLVWYNGYGLEFELKRHDSGNYSIQGSFLRCSCGKLVNTDGQEVTIELLESTWLTCYTFIGEHLVGYKDRVDKTQKLIEEYARNSRLPVLQKIE